VSGLKHCSSPIVLSILKLLLISSVAGITSLPFPRTCVVFGQVDEAEQLKNNNIRCVEAQQK
jgi:hypothetical protein